MKLKKILISFLLILLGSGGLLFGCTTKPINIKAVINGEVVNTVNLELPSAVSLEEDEEDAEEDTTKALIKIEAENANEVFLKGLSVSCSENNIVTTTLKETLENAYVYEIQALYPKDVTVTFTTKDRKESVSLLVKISQDVEKIEKNPMAKNYITLGTDKEISASIINFVPSTTTDKDISFSLAEEYTGVSLINNKLMFDLNVKEITLRGEKVDKIYINTKHRKYDEVQDTEKSKFVVESIEFDVLAKIGEIKAIKNSVPYSNLEFLTNGTGNDNNYQTIAIKQIIDEIDNQTVYGDIDSSYEVKYEFISGADLVSVENGENPNEFVISQNFRDGKAKIVFYTQNKIHSQSERKQVEIDIEIKTRPSYISVNGQRQPENIVLYDNFNTKSLEIVVGPNNAYETRFKVAFDPEQISLKYSNGIAVDSKDSIKSGTILYISCAEGISFASGSSISSSLRIQSLSEEVTSTIYVDIVKSLEAVNVICGGLTDNSFSISKIDALGNNNIAQFKLHSPENIYIPTYSIEIEDENIVSLNNLDYNSKTFNLKALTSGSTIVTVVFDNGYEKEITISVYMPVSSFKLDIDDTSKLNNIGEITYNNTSLASIAIKQGKSAEIVIKAYDNANRLITDKNIYTVTYVLEDNDNNIAISNVDNVISSIKETENPVTVTVKISAINLSGVLTEFTLTFNVSVYIPIERLVLSESYVSLYTENTVGESDKHLATKTIQVTIEPSNATYQLINYSLNFASDVTVSEEKISDNEFKIVANSISNVQSSTGTIAFSVQEFGLVYNKKVTIKISNAIKPEGILLDNVDKNEDEEGNKADYLYFNLGLSGAVNVNPKVYPLDSYNLNYNVEIQSLTENPEDIVSVQNGSVTPLKPGQVIVTFKPVGNENVSRQIYIVVADGSEENPYAIQTKEDFLSLCSTNIVNDTANQDAKYSKFYRLINDIDLSGEKIYPIGMYKFVQNNADTYSVNSFTGGFDGEFTIGGIKKAYTISGISLNVNYGDLYYYNKFNEINLGLFAINEGTIKNLNVYYSNISILASEKTTLPLSVEDTNTTTFNFGGIVAQNKGVILNSYVDFYMGELITYFSKNNIGFVSGLNFEGSEINSVKASGNLNVLDGVSKFNKDNNQSRTNLKTIYAGGIVGLNEGNILDTFNIYSETETLTIFNKDKIASVVNLSSIYNTELLNSNTDSAFGGIVGYNTGIVGSYSDDARFNDCGTSSFGNISAYYNVGGIAGINEGNIFSSFTASKLQAINNVGGLVGYNKSGSITNNAVMFLNDGTTNAKITGKDYVAGLIGKADSSIGNKNFVKSFVSKENYFDVVVSEENYGALYSGSSDAADNVNNNFADFKLYCENDDSEHDYNGSISGIGIIAPTKINVEVFETNLNSATIGSLNKFINASKIDTLNSENNIYSIILYKYNETRLNEYLLNTILSITYEYPDDTQDYQKLSFTQIESLNNDILTITDQGKLIVNKTGNAQIKVSSLLNENVYQFINIKVIDSIPSLEIYTDNLLKNEISANQVLEKGKSYNLFLNELLKQNDIYIEYKLSSGNIISFNAVTPDATFTDLDSVTHNLYKTTNAQIIKAINSGTVNVQVNLYALHQNGYILLPASNSFNISVYDGLKNLYLDIENGVLVMNSSLDATLEIDTDIKDRTNIFVEQAIVQTEENGTETFANDYLKIIQERLIENNVLKYNFKFSIDKTKDFSKIINETIEIKIYTYDNFVSLDSIKKDELNDGIYSKYIKTIKIRIEENNLINLNMSYFADGEVIKDEFGNDVINENELETNFIKIGKIGILKINIYPIENLQSLTISYENADKLNLSLKQVKKVGTNFVDVNTALTNGNKITLDVSKENIYENYLYLKLLTDSPIKENSVYTLKAKINNLPYYYEKQLTTKLSTNLEIYYNNAILNSNGILEGVYAKGVVNSQIITLRISKLNPFDRQYNLTISGRNSAELMPVSERKISDDEYEIDYIIQGLFYSGKDEYIKLYFYIDRVVNNKTERYLSNTLKLNVVDYVVNSINIENVTGGYLTKPYGANYELKVLLNTTNSSEVLNEISNLEEEISKQAIWYLNSEKLTVKDYTDFEVSKSDGYYVISPKEIFKGYNLCANFAISYDEGQVKYKALSLQTANNEVYIDEKIYSNKFRENFGLNFYLQTDINNPVPVYTQDDFVNMKSNANYILMNNLTLENYTIQTADFNSFDGNGYIITLKSVNIDLTKIQNQVSFGLFDTISENSLVKNLNVNINLDTTIDSNFVETNTINLTNIETLYFGTLAGQNNGLIYNCSVLPYTYNGLDDILNINVSNILNNSQTKAYVGGLVAENTGIITNSRSNIKLSVNKGYVAGFSSINSGTISSSYYKNALITNLGEDETTSTTAGFVNTNEGEIKYSYVEGEVLTSDGVYVSNTILSDFNLTTSTGVGGFVYTNSGNIEDCYSNLSLTSQSFSGGFVYTNNGEIERSYAATITEQDSEAHAPFIAIKIEINENAMKKQIKNCFYLNNNKSSVNDNLVEGLSLKQFSDEYYLTNFVINLDNGIWNFRANTTPSLIEANHIAFSQRRLYSSYVDHEGSTIYNYVYDNYYMGHESNPIIISNEEEFINYFTITQYNERNNYYYRLVNNINFSEYSNLPTIYSTFSGRLDGNGLEITNLSISAPSNFNKDSFGLFSKIERLNSRSVNPVVKNLNITPIEVYANTVQRVGTLAGQITNSDIINVNVYSNGIVVQGRNIVGGVVGEVLENSKLINITSNISSNASYTSGNGTCIYNSKSVASENNAGISYAGSVAGVVNTNLTINGNENVRNIVVESSTKAIGEFSGLAFGLICENSGIDNVKVYVNASSYVNATYASGLVVGENRGYISRVETIYDSNVEENLSLFKNATYVIGGIVGFNNNGSIVNSIARVSVINSSNSTVVAGGVAGLSLGGSFSSIIAVNKVKAFKTIGGIIGLSGNQTMFVGEEVNEAYKLDIEENEYALKSNAIIYVSNVVAYNDFDENDLKDKNKNIGAIFGAVFNKFESGENGELSAIVKNSYITENNYFKSLSVQVAEKDDDGGEILKEKTLKDFCAYNCESIDGKNAEININNNQSTMCATILDETNAQYIFERFSSNVFENLLITSKTINKNNIPSLKTKNNINTKTLEGDGTFVNPYEINSVVAINQLAELVENGKNNVYVNVTDNIEATGKEIVSIGLGDYAFNGTFNGNNKYINGLTYFNDETKYSTQSMFGVFANIGSNGTVTNLNIVANFIIKYGSCVNYTGIISGINRGLISNCNVYGGVVAILKNIGKENALTYVGGISGLNAGTTNSGIANCNNYAIIYASIYDEDTDTSSTYSNINIYAGFIAGANINNAVINKCNNKSVSNIALNAGAEQYTLIVVNSNNTDNGSRNCNNYVGNMTGYSEIRNNVTEGESQVGNIYSAALTTNTFVGKVLS